MLGAAARRVQGQSGDIVAAGKANTAIEIVREQFTLREWRPGDVDSLAQHANNVKVSRNLHDAFPHPYTRADAETWIKQTPAVPGGLIFAIVGDGQAVGGSGLNPG